MERRNDISEIQNKNGSSKVAKYRRICSICHRQFASEWHLKDHLLSHTGEKPYKCSDCKKGFRRKHDVKRHMLCHARNKEKKSLNTQNKPEEKQQILEVQTNNISEIQNKNGSRKAKYCHICSICHRQFASDWHLKDHMLSHTGEKPYKCSVCEKGFRRKHDVKRHMLCHARNKEKKSLNTHNKPEENLQILEVQTNNISEIQNKNGSSKAAKYRRICSICHRQFASEWHLKDHLLCHTGEKPYKCFVCEKGFRRKHDVKRHMLCHARNKEKKSLNTHNKPEEKQQILEIQTKLRVPRDKDNTKVGKSQFTCTVCNLQCRNRGNLTSHTLIHTGEKPYKCPVCERHFRRKDELKNHSLVHKDKNESTFVECQTFNPIIAKYQTSESQSAEPKPTDATADNVDTREYVQNDNDHNLIHSVDNVKCYSQGNLKSPVPIHTGEKPHKCPVCGRPFRNKYGLKRHMLVHSNYEESTPWEHQTLNHSVGQQQRADPTHEGTTKTTVVTEETIESGDLLKDHDTFHSVGKQQTYETQPELLRLTNASAKSAKAKHMLIHNKYKKKVCEIKCSICGKKAWNQHKLVHSEEIKFICHVCGKHFKYCQHFEEHMAVHTGEKKHTCDVCGKNFTWEGSLKEHRQHHFEQTRYTCDLCNKTFARMGNLRSHTRLIHFALNRRACSVCSKEFLTKAGLTTHMRIHSGSKPYKCKLCMKGFTCVGNLKKHMQLHTGETPYSCKTCNQQFKRAENLKVHMLIHAGVKPHACEVCGQRFRQKSSMKKHMLRHTAAAQLGDNSSDKLVSKK